MCHLLCLLRIVLAPLVLLLVSFLYDGAKLFVALSVKLLHLVEDAERIFGVASEVLYGVLISAFS